MITSNTGLPDLHGGKYAKFRKKQARLVRNKPNSISSAEAASGCAGGYLNQWIYITVIVKSLQKTWPF